MEIVHTNLSAPNLPKILPPCIGPLSNIVKYCQISSNIVKYCQILSNIVKYCFGNTHRFARTVQNTRKYTQIIKINEKQLKRHQKSAKRPYFLEIVHTKLYQTVRSHSTVDPSRAGAWPEALQLMV